MRKLAFICLFILGQVFAFSQAPSPYALDQLIVKFKTDAQLPSLNRSKGTFNIGALDQLNTKQEVQSISLSGNRQKEDTYLLTFSGERDIEALVKTYQNTNLFEYVEPNYIGTGGGRRGTQEIIPSDTYFSRQYGLKNNGFFSLFVATNDADIDMELGWDIETGSESTIVAILDTGVKLDHPEFKGRIWKNDQEESDSKDSDSNGYIDDLNGWDFAFKDNDPTDDHGHGTNVAGIVGANGDNDLGYAGVDWHCKLMICKILNANNFGYYSWWTEAIYYAVNNGAKVINMSVGGKNFSRAMEDAVNYAHEKGVTIVACMMNTDSETTYYPAGYDHTIAVGATNPNDQRSDPFFWDRNSGSNFGSHIDVVAPGNYIYGLSHQSNTNYDFFWGGTSQATPLVTGLSALLLAQKPKRTPDDIRHIIRNTAEDLIGKMSEDVAGFDKYYGYGRVNAHKALSYQDDVTAAKNPEFKEKIFAIHPNPSTDHVMITGELKNVKISLTNAAGTLLYEKSIGDNQRQLRIDVSDFPKGIYLLQVFSKDDGMMRQSERIIVN